MWFLVVWTHWFLGRFGLRLWVLLQLVDCVHVLACLVIECFGRRVPGVMRAAVSRHAPRREASLPWTLILEIHHVSMMVAHFWIGHGVKRVGVLHYLDIPGRSRRQREVLLRKAGVRKMSLMLDRVKRELLSLIKPILILNLGAVTAAHVRRPTALHAVVLAVVADHLQRFYRRNRFESGSSILIQAAITISSCDSS